MSQINSIRGIVVPSAIPQRGQPRKDRQQRGAPQQEPRDEPKDESETPPEDGKPHVDLKA